ncbi:MAG: GNAT family N-acetyltransferase [Anaerolineaceae bacterium]|nr:GNAT family N-acetyltransferase [Anaerolineaceae bacterium]
MLDLTQSFKTFPVLETERLRLRAMVPQDATAVFALLGDPEVMVWHGRPPFATLEEAQKHIAWYAEAFAEKRAIRWAITRHGEDRVLGTCGFHHMILYHFRAEIGYELASSEWRQGIMAEAVRAIVRFGLVEMGLHRIEAIVDPTNTASARLLRKIGFTEEGFLRERFWDNGRFTDDWFFSILASEIDKVR